MDLIEKMREARAAKKADLDAILSRDDADISAEDTERADGLLADIKAADERIAAYEQVEQREAAAVAARVETGVEKPVERAATTVTREQRTYNPGSDPTGRYFLADMMRSQLMGDIEAQQRLGRHMAEERVERGEQIEARTLAPLTTAFSGLVVPQYLTDLVAPYAKAGRPLADAIRSHPLPDQGMTVNISRITTATTAAVQTQGNAVSETAIDDTILTVDVLTNAGSQTASRQAVERGDQVLDTILEDLLTSYHSNLDNELLNQATNGLATAASAVTWTDNTDPTQIEFVAQVAKAAGNVETALKNRATGDTIVVMHPRRWFWLLGGGSSSLPVVVQSGVPAGVNAFGVDYAARYGGGFRGVINGLPVVVDSNIVTNLGTATNQDEVYVLSASEAHLWETPNAPLFIRTEVGPNMKALGVDIVCWGYFAFSMIRYAQAQRVTGSGLVTPA